MKHKIILVLLAIAVFIPTAVAIASYRSTLVEPVSAKNIQTMELSDLAGKTTTFSARGGKSEESMINFFLQMNEDATKISSLPAPLVGTSFFKVSMKSAQKTADYQYYFSTNPQEAYFLNGAGEAYQISEKYAAEFIGSKYASSLYLNAVVPSLEIAGWSGGSVLPKNALWMYKNSAGAFVECDPDMSAAAQSVSLEGGLDMGFTIQPDNFSLKLTDHATGAVVYNDQYANIDSLTLAKSVVLDVEITAKWYEDVARDYYGEMEYAFTADIAAPASFRLADTAIENGTFTVVSATNIADPSRVIFSSEPEIDYAPTFFLDGELAYALLPIRCDQAAGAYTLTFKYGGVTENLTLNVTQKPVRQFENTVTAAIARATRTEQTLASYADATASAFSTGSAERYWDGLFLQPQGLIIRGFGHRVRVTATGDSYTSDGVEYSVSAVGQPVAAVNRGKVVFAGYTEFGGNTVVIEHGYGLKSWYRCMDSLSVSVGDVVEKGAAIGTTGKTGFCQYTGVTAGLCVFDVPVSPYPSWEKEIKLVP